MRNRGEAAQALGQQRAEGGARLQPLIPFLGDGEFVPVDLAEIVEHGNSRCRREIGVKAAQMVAALNRGDEVAAGPIIELSPTLSAGETLRRG